MFCLYYTVCGHVCKLCIYFKKLHNTVRCTTYCLFFYVRTANMLIIMCVAVTIKRCTAMI